MRYFKNKVESYKLQDRKAKREINEETYITAEWCLKMFKSRWKNVIHRSILKPSKASYVATLRRNNYAIFVLTMWITAVRIASIVMLQRIEKT